MKIRIGVGFGGWPFERTQDFWDFVDIVEESGLDSIWINDRIRNPAPALEPITALAMIAGRLSFQTDAFVIGSALGPEAITFFGFGNKLVELAKAVLRSPIGAASRARLDGLT